MGWLFSSNWGSRAEMIRHLTRPERFGEKFKLLRSCPVGNNHWYLVNKVATDRNFIGLDLMKGGTKEYPGWGYKDLDESVGPSEVNCPLSLLRDAGLPEEVGDTIEWRARVRKYHADRKARPAPQAGMLVTLGPTQYRLVEPYLPRQGWVVSRLSDGAQMRMSSAQLGRALAALVRPGPVSVFKPQPQPTPVTQQSSLSL